MNNNIKITKITLLLIILVTRSSLFCMDHKPAEFFKNQYDLQQNKKIILIDEDQTKHTTSLLEQLPNDVQYEIIEQLLLQENKEDRAKVLASLACVNKHFNQLCDFKTLPKKINSLLSLEKLIEFNLKKAIFIVERIEFSNENSIELKKLADNFTNGPKTQWMSYLNQAVYDLYNKTTDVTIDHIDLINLVLIDLCSLPARDDYETYHQKIRTFYEQKEILLLQEKELDAFMSLLPLQVPKREYNFCIEIYRALLDKWKVDYDYTSSPKKIISEKLGLHLSDEEIKTLHKPIQTAILS